MEDTLTKMDHLFSAVLTALEMLKTDTEKMKVMAEPSLDPKLLARTFLEPSDFGLMGGARAGTGSRKPRRWHREEIGRKYNVKMAEVVSVWLEKFSPSPSSRAMVEVAVEKVALFLKAVIAGGDQATENAGMICLFVCLLFVCLLLSWK